MMKVKKIRIYWKKVLLYSIIFFAVTLGLELIVDQVYLLEADKINNIYPIESVIDLNREIQFKLLNLADIILNAVTGLSLVLSGAVVASKVNKNKVVNGGIAVALVMAFLTVSFFIYKATVTHRMNQFSDNPRPLFNLNTILNPYYIMSIPYAFLIGCAGAYLWVHFLKHRHSKVKHPEH